MFIKNTSDLSNLKINMDTFKSDYIANGGNANCYFKGGGSSADEPSNLTVKDFMNTYLPILRGGYKKSQKRGKGSRKTKGGEGTTIEESDATGNFFHRIAINPGPNYSSHPDLTFNDYKFPDSMTPAYR